MDVSPSELELAVATSACPFAPPDERYHRRHGGRYGVAGCPAISRARLRFLLSGAPRRCPSAHFSARRC